MNSRIGKGILVALLIMAGLILVPAPAFAGIKEDATEILVGFMAGIWNGLIKDFIAGIQNISTLWNMTGDFETALAGAPGAYALVTAVTEVAIRPVAETMLYFSCMMQLLRISQRVDGHAVLPGIKEIAFLLLYFALCSFLIYHSIDIMKLMYQMAGWMTNQITGGATISAAEDFVGIDTENVGVSIAMIVPAVLLAFLLFLVGLIAQIVCVFIVAARSIQIYVYTMVSPIPMAFLGFEGLRQYGTNFLRNYAALCFSGVIMVVIISLFPTLITSLLTDLVNLSNNLFQVTEDNAQTILQEAVQGVAQAGQAITSSNPVTETAVTMTVNMATWSLKLIQIAAYAILLVFALVKSGSWARDAFGG